MPAGKMLAAVFAVALVLQTSPVTAAAESPPPSPSPPNDPTQTPTPTAAPTPTPTAAPPPTTPTATPTPSPTPSPAPTPSPLAYPSDPLGYIDSPAPNTSVFAGSLWVWGWAIDRNANGAATGVDRVVLYLDGPPGVGTLVGTATYGVSRPDVATYV